MRGEEGEKRQEERIWTGSRMREDETRGVEMKGGNERSKEETRGEKMRGEERREEKKGVEKKPEGRRQGPREHEDSSRGEDQGTWMLV